MKVGKQEGMHMAEKVIQTAGRQQLGEFAPEFAHFNDDVPKRFFIREIYRF